MSVPIAKLTEVAELNPRLSAPLEVDARVSFVPMASVKAETASVANGEERKYSEVSKGYTSFINGDVLIAKITPCFENGKIAQATLSHHFGFGSTEFHVVRARLGKADPRYLLHFLRQEHIRFDGERKMTGSAGQRRVPEHFLAGLEIPLPSLTEQRRIAAILDKADELRAKRRFALGQLDVLLNAIFIDLFGDPVTNLKGWPLKAFGSEIKSVRYGTGSPPEYSAEGAPFIRATNVKSGTVNSQDLKRISAKEAERLTKCRVKYGDLIVVRSGVNTGDCAFIPEAYDGAYAAFDLIVELPLANAVFYNFLINSAYGKRVLSPLTRRAAQPHLNAEQLRTLQLIVPPSALKEKFARRVATLDTLKAAHRTSLGELDALFASLRHRAFRGEL